MKKFSNILFVSRPETENEWWHRLFTVVLFASGAVVFIISAVLVTVGFNDHPWDWVIYKPSAFSLESNYAVATGTELPCQEDLFAFPVSETEPLLNGEGIKCDGVALSETESKHYAVLYNSAQQELKKQFGLDKYDGTCAALIQSRQSLEDIFSGKARPQHLTQEEIACVRTSTANEEADPAYSQYQEALKNLSQIKIKVARDVNVGVIISDTLLWLRIPILSVLLWVVFWSSIIYRSILYIIFGKKK